MTETNTIKKRISIMSEDEIKLNKIKKQLLGELLYVTAERKTMLDNIEVLPNTSIKSIVEINKRLFGILKDCEEYEFC